jgi:hypothetical protein
MRTILCALLLTAALLPAATYEIKPAGGPVRVDGVLDEPVWAAALRIDRFYEVDPGDNTEPPVKTTAWFAYDDAYFYAAFRCDDPEPEQIRGRYADRDSAFPDDFIGFQLDPFRDRRNGVEFFVNPLGAQMDLTVAADGREDGTWDAIWDAAGRITPEGYEVEMAIPFQSLRFPKAEVQAWNFIVLRVHPRNFRRLYASAPQDRDLSCGLCQLDTMDGLRGIRPGHNIELVPTLTGIRTDARETSGAPMESGGTDAEAGLSGLWGVTPNLTLSGAVNPDFSQVEADARQIDVNTRFALFYDEKRPFFLEGRNYFQTDQNLVYTRTIADPDWGLKFTGKEGAHGIGALLAEDRQANFLIPSNAGSDLFTWDEPVTTGAFRYRRDLGRDSTVGVLYTDRRGDGYANQVYGADGRIRLGDADVLTLQAVGSSTRYPEAPGVDPAFDGSERDGASITAAYVHDSRHWYWELSYLDRDPDFRADLGFVPRVDLRYGMGFLSYTFRSETSPWWSRLRPSIWCDFTEDHGGTLTDWSGGGELNMKLARQTDGEVAWGRAMERYNGTDYLKNRFHVQFNSRFNRTMTAFVRFETGDQVDYANDRLGDATALHLQYDVRLWRRFFLWLEGSLERLDIAEGTVYDARIYYVKGLYHFSNALFIRGIVQFYDVDRDPALYRDEVMKNEKSLGTQLLLTYKVNPFTLAYLGYSDFGIEDDRTDRTTLNRTLFVKFSYAWRP